jgi:hypothetical protein
MATHIYLTGRDKYKKIGMSEALLGRAQKLKLPRATINIHLCENCIKEHRKREEDFLMMANYQEGGNVGSFCVLTINCCSSCLEANIQLGLMAQRNWKAESVETCKSRKAPVFA